MTPPLLQENERLARKRALVFARVTLERAAEIINEGGDGAITDTIWAGNGLTLFELINHTLDEVRLALGEPPPVLSCSECERLGKELETARSVARSQLEASSQLSRSRDAALAECERKDEALRSAERALRWTADGNFDDYDGSGTCTLAGDVAYAYGRVCAALSAPKEK